MVGSRQIRKLVKKEKEDLRRRLETSIGNSVEVNSIGETLHSNFTESVVELKEEVEESSILEEAGIIGAESNFGFDLNKLIHETPLEVMLCDENKQLREEIQGMKASIDSIAKDVVQIKSLLVDLADGISTQTAYLKLLTMRDNAISPHHHLEVQGSTFPISSEIELMEVDLKVSENKQKYIGEMRMLLRHAPMSRSIKQVMTEDLICGYNVDGVSGKKSLRDYKSFLSALLEAIILVDASQPAEKSLRSAMASVKNNASHRKKRK
ncbi:maker155 [Drosophila busckii]|uniref:Maker155 n=1 Tax=Drosophila busckii TaxID=30019 RepID=A0A0M3QX49_DROBS|nr:uncharacterized protein LOC108602533 [Drosophila busckii]ALC45313.1 maker155 [Drosophila busckii]